MAWNHRAMIAAMAVAIQPVPGTFTAPNNTTDVVPVSAPNNNFEAITADDPTLTGTIWRQRRIMLGTTATAGATIPLRGPGGAAPPVANAWPQGRILQSMGMTEVRNGAAIAGVTQGGSTTSAVQLAAGASATDDLYVGAPLQTAALGTGFRQTTLIADYDGTGKLATVPETIVAPAAGVAYTIPPYLSYVLGTLNTPPALLSVSVWRDKKRYDYKDWRPTSGTVDVPVTNEQNTVFSSIDFAGRGKLVGIYDDETPTGAIQAQLNVPIPPVRGGKFALDRTKVGHQSIRFAVNFDVAAASNQNQDAGQDSFDITGGQRTISLDLNQSAQTDLDVQSRVDAQTIMPVVATWGMGAGNRFGVIFPNVVLDPQSPGERNGFVNMTGDAHPTDFDKSFALTIWW